MNLQIDRAAPIIMLRPGYQQVAIDEQFPFAVVLSNPKKKAFDRMSIILKYDPRFLELLDVEDERLREIAGKNFTPTLEHLRPGVFEYKAEFLKPLNHAYAGLMLINFKALSPSTGTDINFSNYGKIKTGLFLGDTEILSESKKDFFSVSSLGAQVIIKENFDLEEKDDLVILKDNWDKPKQITTTENNQGHRAALGLKSDKEKIKVGDVFDVHLLYSNPASIPVERVKVILRFDPEYLQVVDHDKDNFIENGINIHDGPYHKKFPFNMHLKNLVNNKSGRIVYEVATRSPKQLADLGRLATIRLVSVKSTDYAPIWFETNAAGKVISEVISTSDNLLLDTETKTAHVQGAAVQILD